MKHWTILFVVGSLYWMGCDNGGPSQPEGEENNPGYSIGMEFVELAGGQSDDQHESDKPNILELDSPTNRITTHF